MKKMTSNLRNQYTQKNTNQYDLNDVEVDNCVLPIAFRRDNNSSENYCNEVLALPSSSIREEKHDWYQSIDPHYFQEDVFTPPITFPRDDNSSEDYFNDMSALPSSSIGEEIHDWYQNIGLDYLKGHVLTLSSKFPSGESQDSYNNIVFDYFKGNNESELPVEHFSNNDHYDNKTSSDASLSSGKKKLPSFASSFNTHFSNQKAFNEYLLKSAKARYDSIPQYLSNQDTNSRSLENPYRVLNAKDILTVVLNPEESSVDGEKVYKKICTEHSLLSPDKALNLLPYTELRTSKSADKRKSSEFRHGLHQEGCESRNKNSTKSILKKVKGPLTSNLKAAKRTTTIQTECSNSNPFGTNDSIVKSDIKTNYELFDGNKKNKASSSGEFLKDMAKADFPNVSNFFKSKHSLVGSGDPKLFVQPLDLNVKNNSVINQTTSYNSLADESSHFMKTKSSENASSNKDSKQYFTNYNCTVCWRNYTRKRSVISHIKKAHPEINFHEMLFQCNSWNLENASGSKKQGDDNCAISIKTSKKPIKNNTIEKNKPAKDCSINL